MLAARASRNAVSTRHVARCLSPLVIHAQSYRNFSYSSQHAKAQDASDPSNAFPKTRLLDRHLGKERVAKVKASSKFLRDVQHELTELYGRYRRLEHVMKGPYKVRTSNAKAGPSKDPVVKVNENKVTVNGVRVPNIWLRDNCQCASCMHDATKQRLLDTFSLPQDIAIKSHLFSVEGSKNPVLRLDWSDGHTSRYPISFLQQTIQTEEDKAVQRQGLSPVTLWDASISSEPPTVTYPTTMKVDILGLLRRLRRYGFCYVDATPSNDPSDTKKLLERIAFIRETHYGGFYDFTADLASKDTAYTNIALEAHTDTTYFSDPAGLQAFHLLSHTDGKGGASLLVDGFKVAEELLQTDKKAYEILSTVNVHGHASGNDGISIQPYRGFPVLEHDLATGDLVRVRWNSSDRASIELPIDQVETWYDAARKFDALLKKRENEYWEQLVPGKVLIFDNWRVLHGRSSFTGKRRICGGYVNRDDWISRWKMEEFGKDTVLQGLAVN